MSDPQMFLEMSTTCGALFAALAAAQAKIEGAKKDSLNPHFKNKYADLSSVWDACREALSSQKLCVIQTFRQCGGGAICVVTTLGHASGEWIRGELTLPASKADAQGMGSAATYARRYGLAAIVGVAPEDDDGNAATVPPQQRGPIKAPAPPPPTREQQAEQLPKALESSVDLMERAVDANAMLAEAKTLGALNEAWGFANMLRKEGLPNKHFDALKAMKDKRKTELSPANGAVA